MPSPDKPPIKSLVITKKTFFCAFLTLVIFVFLVCVHLTSDADFVTRVSTRIARTDFRTLLSHLRELSAFNGSTVYVNPATAPPDQAATTEPVFQDRYGNFIHNNTDNQTRKDACESCMKHNYKYVINNDSICHQYTREQEITLLVLILTVHKNLQQREAIRDTWMSVARGNKGNVRYAFLLGETSDVAERKAVLQESQTYGDILKEDFVDVYSNLTLKTMMGMKWATTSCNVAQFLMKTDDDMFVNIPAVLKLVSARNQTLQTSVAGGCHLTARPIRDIKSKWFASIRSYPNPTYPGFCSGTGYVTSLNVARKIYEVSPHIPYFHLEDVYVALCVRKLGFHLVAVKGFNVGKPKQCINESTSQITSHRVSPSALREIWQKPCAAT